MTLATFASVVLGAAFVVSGAAKVANPAWPSQAAGLGAPTWATGPLPFVELGLGALAVVGLGRRPTAIALGCLLVAFTALLVARLARGLRPVCGCFGGRRAKPISWWSVARNAVLLGAAGIAAFA